MKIKWLTLLLIATVTLGTSCEDEFTYKSDPPKQNPVYSIYDFLKRDTTLEMMVLAIDRAGLQSMYSSTDEKKTLLAVSDAAWRAELKRTATTGYPNPYKGKTINDIPVDNLRNFILGLTIPGELYTTSQPFPFDVTVASYAPGVSLRLQVENYRYQLRVNRAVTTTTVNPAATANGRTHFRSNIQMTNGVLFTFDNLFSLIP